MRSNRVAQAPLSRNAVSNVSTQNLIGEQMAIIPMIPVGRVTTLNRSILLTERRMSSTDGDDLFVDTVGMSCWRISILQQSAAIPSISAAFARTTMTYHSPPVMVAIGLLGMKQSEISRRPPAGVLPRQPPLPASMQSEDAAREMPGFSVGDPCATKSAQIYLQVL